MIDRRFLFLVGRMGIKQFCQKIFIFIQVSIIFYEKLNSPYDNFNIEYGMDLHNLIFNYFNSIEHENNLFLNKAAPNKIYSFFENYINFDDFIENNGSNSDSEESLDN